MKYALVNVGMTGHCKLIQTIGIPKHVGVGVK